MQYVRFVRSNLTVTIRLSSDGIHWEDAFKYDLPADSLCVPHRLLLDSSAWFHPDGAYADYDYIRFARTR